VSAVFGCFADSLPPPTAQSFEGIEIEIPMTDSHVRLLAAVRRRRKRDRELAHRTARARTQMSAARARRRLATGDEGDA
jgi:hypothetical protein